MHGYIKGFHSFIATTMWYEVDSYRSMIEQL